MPEDPIAAKIRQAKAEGLSDEVIVAKLVELEHKKTMQAVQEGISAPTIVSYLTSPDVGTATGIRGPLTTTEKIGNWLNTGRSVGLRTVLPTGVGIATAPLGPEISIPAAMGTATLGAATDEALRNWRPQTFGAPTPNALEENLSDTLMAGGGAALDTGMLALKAPQAARNLFSLGPVNQAGQRMSELEIAAALGRRKQEPLPNVEALKRIRLFEEERVPFGAGDIFKGRFGQLAENYARGGFFSGGRFAPHDIQKADALNDWKGRLLNEISGIEQESPVLAASIRRSIEEGSQTWNQIFTTLYDDISKLGGVDVDPSSIRTLGYKMRASIEDMTKYTQGMAPPESKAKYDTLVSVLENYGTPKGDAALRKLVGEAAISPNADREIVHNLAMLQRQEEMLPPNLAQMQSVQSMPAGSRVVGGGPGYGYDPVLGGGRKVTFKDLNYLRQAIGQHVRLYEQGDPYGTQAKAALQEMYSVVDEAMSTAAAKMDPQMQAAWQQVNHAYKTYVDVFDRASFIRDIRTAQPGHEAAVIERLFRPGEITPALWQDVSKTLTADERLRLKPQVAREAVTRIMERITRMGAGEQRVVSGEMLLRDLDKSATRKLLGEYLSDEQITGIRNFAKASTGTGLINPMSGRLPVAMEYITNGYRLFTGLGAATAGLVTGQQSETGYGIAAAGFVLVAPEVMARLVLNPRVAKFFARGFSMAPAIANATGWTTRALNMIRIASDAPDTDFSKLPDLSGENRRMKVIAKTAAKIR